MLALAPLSLAHAATSDWAVNEGGRMRLVAQAPDASGHVRAALQIEPAPGWVTYWREPGESGIPPQITPPPDSKSSLEKIGYPVPKLITLGTIREIGYDEPITLPLDLSVGEEKRLDLSVFIGVCKQICIPFQANLSVALPSAGTSDSADDAILAAADAALPEKPAADFAVQSHGLSADGKALSLSVSLPDSGEALPQIYVTGPSGYVFFDQSDASRSGSAVRTSIAIGGLPKSYVAKGKTWGVLVIDGKRAMETTIAID